MSETATLAFEKTSKKQRQIRDFNPPAVGVGDTVHYYHGRPPEDAEDGDLIGGRAPTAAKVAAVTSTPGMLVLSAIEPDSYAFRTFDENVRHVDDPRLLHDLGNDTERGFWTLPPASALTLSADEISQIRILLSPPSLNGKAKAA
jgi:hypothetical protein